MRSGATITAGKMLLDVSPGSNTFRLKVEYNSSCTAEVDIRGEDELHALKFLVDRMIAKLEKEDSFR